MVISEGIAHRLEGPSSIFEVKQRGGPVRTWMGDDHVAKKDTSSHTEFARPSPSRLIDSESNCFRKRMSELDSN